MKNFYLIACLLLFTVFSNGQDVKPDFSKKVVRNVSSFGKTGPLRDVKEKPVRKRKKLRVVPNKLRRYKYTNIDALPVKKDPVLQSVLTKTPALSPIESWDGIDHTSQQATPPDPSGAAGKSHYVQMVNTAMQVYNKSGTSLWGPTSLSAVFPGSSNDGDPIVMYDKYADRWFISQFQTAGNEILIAISQTNDPLGSWYYYSYSFSEFPDYPKYSIWNNGYYMTANMGSENAVCFEREKMLAGDPTARMVALTIPNVETNGFFSAMPAHADGDLLPKMSVPQYLFYYQDDGWATGKDRINIWEMKVDWAVPNLASITLTQELEVAPFNTDFDENWNDLIQPGTSQRLDAVPGSFMYMGQFKNFKNHNSMLLSHTVDVDLTTEKRAAIRWYELRQNNSSTWEVHQEGTYGPSDGDSRWMGCMAMDRRGNIGLAYAKTGTSTYPSIDFTGRKEGDALGVMTINESVAFTGTGAQTNTNRFGDYGHMMLDPVDELTFWYTGEYMGTTGWKTGIFSFKIGEDYSKDLSIVEVLNPVEGVLTSNEKVTVVIKNLGQDPAVNFPISINLNGTVTTDTYSGTLSAGDTVHYTLNGTYDFSNLGFNTVQIYSDLLGDEDLNNDTVCVEVFNKYQNDISITEVLSPKSGVGLASDTVKVYVENVGSVLQSNFTVSYNLNGSINSEIYTGSIAPGVKTIFKFSNLVDLSTVGAYDLTVYSSLGSDQYLLNDTTKSVVENKSCSPSSDCNFGDEISLFKLNEINNTTGCVGSGYSDYTAQLATVIAGQTETITVNSGTDEYLSVWIDFNDNFVFENSETILVNQQFDNVGVFNFTLPQNSSLGVHLLRARINWSSNSDDPCAVYDYGEIEDYKVEVVDDKGLEEEVNFDFKILSLDKSVVVQGAQKYAGVLNLEMFNSLGQKVDVQTMNNGAGEFELSIGTNELSSGIYYLRLSDKVSQLSKQFLVK